MKVITKYGREVEVIHKMKDGTIRDNLDDVMLTLENIPPLLFKILWSKEHGNEPFPQEYYDAKKGQDI